MASLYTHPRADWTTRDTDAHRFNTTVRGTYLHWPGSHGHMHGETPEQIAQRLRGYRDYHVRAKGWRDIAYNVAVDWRGEDWELRGIDRESGANGGTVSNNHGVSILLLLGIGEVPSQAMIDGVLRVLANIGAMHSSAEWVRGHRQSPDAGGACPGPEVMGLLKAGRFHYRGAGTSVQPAPEEVSEDALTDSGELVVDGRQGIASSKALQRFLNSRITTRTLTIDGRLGPETYLSLQEYLGAPYIDGEISRQSYEPADLGNGVGPYGWDYTGPNSEGSQTVELLQAWVGVTVDGIWYEGTSAALQAKLNDHGVGM